MFSPEIAVIAGLLANSWASQPPASTTSRMISSGLCSSHSPGRVGLVWGGAVKLGSTPQALASRALAALGAVM
ncbi:hypothetical protein D3C79_1085170 [compost metagenome]